MTLNLHIMHIISILENDNLLISHQLKGKKRGLQSCNLATRLVETSNNSFYLNHCLNNQD
jgi:hypothetical protein